MAKKVVLEDISGNKCYPVTRDVCILSGNKTLPEKIKDISDSIPLSTLYHKDNNLILNPFNFSRFGYYPNTNLGTSFVHANDNNNWRIGWSVIFIPVKKDIVYTVTNAQGPDKLRKIVMVDLELKVTHGIENTENQITALEGDYYLAVQYGADVRCSNSYYIDSTSLTALEAKQVSTEAKQVSLNLNVVVLGKILANENILSFNSYELRIGYFKDTGEFLDTSNVEYGKYWGTYIVPILPNKTYKWSSYVGIINANHAVLDSSKKVIRKFKISSIDEYRAEQEFVAESNAVYFALQIASINNPTNLEKSYIKCTENITLEDISLTHKVEKNKKDIIKSNETANEAKSKADETRGIIDGSVSADLNILGFGEVKTGYYANNGRFVDTSSNYSTWKTIIIPIEPLKKYKWSSYSGTPNANHAILNENKEVVKLLSITAAEQYREEQTLLAEAEHYYFALQVSERYIANSYFKPTENIILESLSLSKKVEKNAADIEQIKKEGVGTRKVFSVMNIPYIFGMVNSALYSREYVVRLFPESFLDVKPDSPALINYRRDAAISRQRKTTTNYEKIVKQILLSAEGYENKTVSLNFHVLNEKVYANKNIRLSLFGVSFDSIDYQNDDGTKEEGGTMTSALLEKYLRMSAKDNDYNVNYVSIGTLGHRNGDTFQYKGETLNSRGKHEARGGNNGVCYLRQPMNFSPTNVDYDPNVSGTSATGLIQWLMNGLRYRVPYNQEYSTSGTDYGTFEKTVDKLKALRYTPFGKYHHDYAEELWEFCNKKGWIGKVSGSYSAWTGSEEQKQIIDDCMDYVAENPDYPFFDRDTARETSYSDGGIPKDVLDKTQYALNYNKYLERYRTMDDLGVRLSIVDENPAGKSVEGSDGEMYTIGSKVTSKTLLEKYDVCKPTHVLWDMMYNDWGYYASGDTGYSDGTDALEMTELFIEAIKKQLGEDIIFGLKAKKSNGSFFPDVWGDICLGQSYSPNGSLINYNKLLINKYSDLSEKVSWIPIFPTSIPFATNYTQEFEDFVYDKILVGSGDTYSSTSDVTHEGLRSAKSMTYQIYGWLAYTVKDL